MAVKIPKIKKRKSWHAKFGDFILALAALAIIAFLAASNWRIWHNRQDLDAEIKDLRQQAMILEERRQALEAGLSAAQGESFQEERLREQGYKKPGEEVIAVLQDGQTLLQSKKTAFLAPTVFGPTFGKKSKELSLENCSALAGRTCGCRITAIMQPSQG